MSEAGNSKHNRLTLLVAEDNAVNQSVIRHQLESLGHDLVFMASNGKALLEGLTTYEGDAILMDCQMPDMDGYAATQAIRAMEAAGRSPWGDRKCWIIAMTANTMEGDREHCISAGMDDYTSKPVKESELRQVLSRIPARTAVSTQSSILGRRFPVVSARALASLRELGGPTGDVLLQTLVGQFLESGQKLLDDIQQAWSQGDTAKLRLGVHTLQGSAANFGAQSLVHVCVRAEQAVTEEHFENISKAVALIPQAFDEVRIALKDATAAVRDQSLI
jgi:CheY-like chemotaxis protein